LTAWRRALHAHPKLGFEQGRTAARAAKPGASGFLGEAGSAHSCMVHNRQHDSDEGLVPVGGSDWLSLAQQELPLA